MATTLYKYQYRCSGITKEKKQCKRPVKIDGGRCHDHKKPEPLFILIKPEAENIKIKKESISIKEVIEKIRIKQAEIDELCFYLEDMLLVTHDKDYELL